MTRDLAGGTALTKTFHASVVGFQDAAISGSLQHEARNSAAAGLRVPEGGRPTQPQFLALLEKLPQAGWRQFGGWTIQRPPLHGGLCTNRLQMVLVDEA